MTLRPQLVSVSTSTATSRTAVDAGERTAGAGARLAGELDAGTLGLVMFGS
jgi:hypothetical protein